MYHFKVTSSRRGFFINLSQQFKLQTEKIGAKYYDMPIFQQLVQGLQQVLQYQCLELQQLQAGNNEQKEQGIKGMLSGIKVEYDNSMVRKFDVRGICQWDGRR
eukprot:TRINITY_DN10327_c0_g2_i1.p5 TRINITY_DN10327_c0_g2~~TRINITY_DN10327_c0_g2_i1.p5  ORF type:complete len:103 (-),score=5.17 TRINITY_DN10327_c0_g2_i1:866-1174(-)